MALSTRGPPSFCPEIIARSCPNELILPLFGPPRAPCFRPLHPEVEPTLLRLPPSPPDAQSFGDGVYSMSCPPTSFFPPFSQSMLRSSPLLSDVDHTSTSSLSSKPRSSSLTILSFLQEQVLEDERGLGESGSTVSSVSSGTNYLGVPSRLPSSSAAGASGVKTSSAGRSLRNESDRIDDLLFNLSLNESSPYLNSTV